MPSLSPALTAATAAVDESDFVKRADGAQSTAAAVTARLLDMLKIELGMRVLEIGTGAGYATALLTELVGPTGHVTSISATPEPVERVATLLARRGVTDTTLSCGDPMDGAPDEGGFDRIVSWATATHLPAAWVGQANPGAVILTPVALTSLSKVGAGVIVDVAAGGEPTARSLFPARYVEMRPGGPPSGVDVQRRDAQGQDWWLSGEHLREPAAQTAGEDVVGLLIEHGRQVSGPLRPGESVVGFTGWLMATQPIGLTTAALGDTRWRIGVLTADGAALMNSFDGTDTTIVGDDAPAYTMAEAAAAWRAAGKPGLAAFTPRLVETDGGWLVRAEAPGPDPTSGSKPGTAKDDITGGRHDGHQH